MKILVNNISKITALLLTATVIFWACESDDRPPFVTDVSVNINSFSVNGVEGEINHQESKITATLPYGTDRTALTPQISIPEGATITPSLGTVVNFSSPVEYKVVNGNIFKKYSVSVVNQTPIVSFVINGLSANINNSAKTIALTLPAETDVTALQPVIELAEGVSISPQSGTTIDFSSPVVFTVSLGSFSEQYTATISVPVDGVVVAFLGTAPTKQNISNLDEVAASDWLFENYLGATYISFADIENGTSLDDIDLIWWHYDEDTNLPSAALSANVVSALQNYLTNGGNVLLTTFASQYVEALNIVPAGKGPNNVFGDFLPNGFVDHDNSWGVSFVGHENHPVFQGLETFTTGKANLLEKGTFRLNHTAWWFLPEWGGYGDGAGWRSQTGGNNLASEDWDDALNGRVTIAEFPGGTADKKAIVISMGAYDWYNENDSNGNPSQPNGYINNIRILTANSIDYLINN